MSITAAAPTQIGVVASYITIVTTAEKTIIKIMKGEFEIEITKEGLILLYPKNSQAIIVSENDDFKKYFVGGIAARNLDAFILKSSSTWLTTAGYNHK